jgi:hypothetical protein
MFIVLMQYTIFFSNNRNSINNQCVISIGCAKTRTQFKEKLWMKAKMKEKSS